MEPQQEYHHERPTRTHPSKQLGEQSHPQKRREKKSVLGARSEAAGLRPEDPMPTTNLEHYIIPKLLNIGDTPCIIMKERDANMPNLEYNCPMKHNCLNENETPLETDQTHQDLQEEAHERARSDRELKYEDITPEGSVQEGDTPNLEENYSIPICT